MQQIVRYHSGYGTAEYRVLQGTAYSRVQGTGHRVHGTAVYRVHDTVGHIGEKTG